MEEVVNVHERMPIRERFKNFLGIFGLDLGKSPRSLLVYCEDEMELRRFDPIWIVETEIHTSGAMNEEEVTRAREEALLRLTDYIYGRNHLSRTMELRLPIYEDARPNSNLVSIFRRSPKQSPTMSMMLPDSLEASQLPSPLDPEVHLRRLPPRVVAALTFGGDGKEDDEMRGPANRLMSWMRSLHVIADRLQIARYDRPTGPHLVRKNELHILVKSNH